MHSTISTRTKTIGQSPRIISKYRYFFISIVSFAAILALGNRMDTRACAWALVVVPHTTRHAETLSIKATSPDFSSRLFLARKRPNSRDAADDMSSWYDPVDEDATPDQVFFQEMERQRLINQVGDGSVLPSLDDIGSMGATPPQQQSQQQPQKPRTPSALRSSAAAAAPRFATKASPIGGNGMFPPQTQNGTDPPPNRRRRVPTMEQIQIAEATLSEYESYRVDDNWLNEELQEQMWQLDDSVYERSIQNDESEQDDNPFESDLESEPWDDFGNEKLKEISYERQSIMEVPFPPKGE